MLIGSLFLLASCEGFRNCGDIPSGKFIPNRANCDYFFLCVDGYLMQLKCTPYSVFDPINRICTADCNAPEVTTPTTPTTPTGPTIPTAPTLAPPPIGQNCASAPSGTYIGIPDSCSHFYLCWEGAALVSQCPDGTCFDNQIKECK